MSRGTVNKVIIIGRLGKDPDMRYAPSGTAIASFTLATNHSTKDADGNWNQQTEWHSIKTFGRQAEFVGEYLKKGKLVYIDGRLQTSSWEDQNGQKHYATEVIGNLMIMLDSKGQDTSMAGPEFQDNPFPDTDKAPKSSNESPNEDDDLPF